MAFPSEELDVEVGLFIDGVWVDAVTDGFGVREDNRIQISRGRANWSSRAETGRASWTLDNRDGRWSPDNPSSPYFGKYRRNTPCRIGVSHGDSYLGPTDVFGDVATTPDSAALDITGDIDIRFEYQLEKDMVDPIAYGGLRGRVASKGNSVNGWEIGAYRDPVSGTDVFAITWYDGLTLITYDTADTGASLPPSSLRERGAIRFTLDASTGSGIWYTASRIGGIWTPLGNPITTAGVTSIEANTEPLRLGGSTQDFNDYEPFPGKIFKFELRDGIDGTLVASPDLTGLTPGVTGFTDSAGVVWSIGAGGRISDKVWRFHGEMASLPVRWNIDGSDVWAPVEAAGLFRRLRQGDEVASPLRRAIELSNSFVVSYWPCEEIGTELTQFGAAIGSSPFVVTGGFPETGKDEGFTASKALPVPKDTLWTAQVDAYPTSNEWQVRWLQSVPSNAVATDASVIKVFTSDMNWEVRYRSDSSGQLKVVAWRGGTSVYESPWIAFAANGTARRMSLSVEQAGSDVTVQILGQDEDEPSASGQTFVSAVAGVVGVAQQIVINTDSEIDEWGMGHVTFQDRNTPSEDLTEPLNAYVGETAANRIARLCAENGIAHRIQGDRSTSAAMGPQPVGNLITLLEDCAETDLGNLFEARERLAVGYRTRGSMTDQPVRISLDYADGEVGGSPEPDRDDQDFGNDIEVKNWTGATARAQIADGSALSVSEPPAGSGRYSRTFGVNAASDTQLAEMATLRLAQTSVDEPRISRLQVALHHEGLAENQTLTGQVLDSSIGDLIAVNRNFSPAFGTTQVRQIFQGVRERLSSFSYEISILTSPASPWTSEFMGFRVEDGKVLTPLGLTYWQSGMHAPVGVNWEPITDRLRLWVFDGLPGDGAPSNPEDYDIYDVWPDRTNVETAIIRFPGGPITKADVFNPFTSSVQSLPDRAYALTGVRSQDAIDAGITQPADHWHNYNVVVPAKLRFEGGGPPQDDELTPHYLQGMEDLANLGFTVSLKVIDLTGQALTLPAELLANPSLDPELITDQAVRAIFRSIDLMIERFGAGRSEPPTAQGSAIVDGAVWFSMPNEFENGPFDQDTINAVVTVVRRIREAGAQNIITIPLARFAQDLAGLAEGLYDPLMDTLESFGIGNNIVMDWHAYGANWAGGTFSTYVGQGGYHEMAYQLDRILNTGTPNGRTYALMVGEYGVATPITSGVGGNIENLAVVEMLATDTYGPPLAAYFDGLLICAWNRDSGKGSEFFKLAYGEDPPGNDLETNGNQWPLWDIESGTDTKLTPFGVAHWDVSRRIFDRSGLPALPVSTGDITFIGSDSFSDQNGSPTVSGTRTLTLPGARQHGDFVLLWLHAQNDALTDMVPDRLSTWTQLWDRQETEEGQLWREKIYYKHIDRTEPDPVITSSGGVNFNAYCGGVMVFRGVDQTTPFDVTSTFGSFASTPSPDSPAIGPSVTDKAAAVLILGNMGNSVSAHGAPVNPSGLQLAETIPNVFDRSMAMAYLESIGSAGTSLGTPAMTWQNTEINQFGESGATSILLRPEAAAQRSVNFRTQLDLAFSGSPPHVLTALGYSGTAKITRAQLDGILDDWVAGTGGTTHNVTSSAEWDTAMTNAAPGDLVRVTSGFTGSVLNARHSRFGVTGANMTNTGTEALPIILTCADGQFVDTNNQASNEPTLDLQNTTHVWAVGFNVKRAQFGIRAQNWGGTAAAPAYIAYCRSEDTGHNGFQIQGWFQALTASGGTPPTGEIASPGNDYGYSEWFVVESNDSIRPGRTANQFGEGFYFGIGSNGGGWHGFCRDFWVRGNHADGWTSDAFDVKPGCYRGRFTDNTYSMGYSFQGSPFSLCLVVDTINDRPAWFNFDPEIYVEGNRGWDNNLTVTNGSSDRIMGYIGLSGMRIANNITWAHPQTSTHAAWRVRNFKGSNDTEAIAEFRTDPTWVINNTHWSDDSVDFGGYGTSPTTFPAAIINAFDLRNNIVDQASPADGEVDVAASDFSAAVPAIGVAGEAEWSTFGPGSAFDLDPASALVGSGEDISDITLLINEDISGRPIPASSPNPGAFQPFGTTNQFQLLYSTDFSAGASVLSDFNLYDGAAGTYNGNNDWGGRRASQVSISTTHPTEGAVMNITAEMGTGLDAAIMVSGGAKLWGASQDYSFRYGRIKFRARVDLDADEVTSGLGLLWQADTPTVKGPEVNIMENFANRDTRNPIQMFLHWGTNGEFQKQDDYGVSPAGNSWHDFECIWLPNLMTMAIDGGTPIVLSTSVTEIPQEDMDFAFQMDGWPDPAIVTPDPLNLAHQPNIVGQRVLQVSTFSIERLV